MKTYLFDTFNRYKRFSEELDAKTILCNKSWWVFNDSGEKEVYIFNTDGTLIIAVSGKVTNATWQYIPANKSLIISGNNQSYMVKPAFYDNQIFALQVDGTNDYAFLIDENNLPSTNLRSLDDLKEHFAEKERQAELAAFMQKKLEEDRERQRLEKEAEERRIRAEKERVKESIIYNLKRNHPLTCYISILNDISFIGPFLAIGGFSLFLLILFSNKSEDFGQYYIYIDTFLKIIVGIVATMFCLYIFLPDENDWGEYLYKKYLKEHQKD